MMNTTIRIYFLMLVVLTSCKSGNNGFNLQKFDVVNKKFSQALYIADSIRTTNFRERKIVLELRTSDSIPEIRFSFQDSSTIREYIFSNNYRIVGYMLKDGEDVILLSNINNKTRFELMFYDFIIPTNEHRFFRYLNFPESQYRISAEGQVYPPSNKEFGYLTFKYERNNFVLCPR